MGFADVLLVTRNYNGECEENFITTVEEFLNKYCDSETPGYTELLKRQISSAKPYEWDGNFYAKPHISYDMRLCQGSEDLINFLSGKFNDSVEAMEKRTPGLSNDSWYWENRTELFSVMAVEKIHKYAQELGSDELGFKDALIALVPDFPFNNALSVVKTSRLADLIGAAEKSRAVSDHTDSRLSEPEL